VVIDMSDRHFKWHMGILQTLGTRCNSFHHYHGVPFIPDDTLENYFDDVTQRKPRESSYIEQIATGLCWQLEAASTRRPGFPSWSWTGWYGATRKPFFWERYIVNTYGLKIWAVSIKGTKICWDLFCNSADIRETSSFD
jgi:hypothetical protein